MTDPFDDDMEQLRRLVSTLEREIEALAPELSERARMRLTVVSRMLRRTTTDLGRAARIPGPSASTTSPTADVVAFPVAVVSREQAALLHPSQAGTQRPRHSC